mgnify:FL=1
MVFNIKPLPTDKVKDYLIENSIADDKNASVFAEYSQGSIGAAVKFAASEDFNELRKKVTGVLRDMGRLSYFELTEAAKELENFKDLTDVTDMIYMWYRDVLVYKTTGSDRTVIQKDRKSVV